MFRKYFKNELGQGMSEYLILVLIIAVGSIAATRVVSNSVKQKLTQIKTNINGLGSKKDKSKTITPVKDEEDGGDSENAPNNGS